MACVLKDIQSQLHQRLWVLRRPRARYELTRYSGTHNCCCWPAPGRIWNSCRPTGRGTAVKWRRWRRRWRSPWSSLSPCPYEYPCSNSRRQTVPIWWGLAYCMPPKTLSCVIVCKKYTMHYSRSRWLFLATVLSPAYNNPWPGFPDSLRIS